MTASKHLFLTFCRITAKFMQCYLLGFECFYIGMCMRFFTNWVLLIVASLSNTKFRNSFPASFTPSSPNGPLTSPYRLLSPLLDPTWGFPALYATLLVVSHLKHAGDRQKASFTSLLAAKLVHSTKVQASSLSFAFQYKCDLD